MASMGDVNNPVSIGSLRCGATQSLTLIAGPCVLETEEAALEIARGLIDQTDDLPIQLVFKASFDKANRTSLGSYRGPGMEAGLDMLTSVQQNTGLAVTTDIHLPSQADEVSRVCDLLQIPAFLARQTDLLVAAAETGKAVHVKKGQFMAPGDMHFVVEKLRMSGCSDVLLCERGTFFGYGNLVNDMRSLPLMRQIGVPVIFDATHSVQQPAALNGTTGGDSSMVPALARAAVASGVDGIFLETHPEPEKSPSDGANMIPLAELRSLLEQLVAIREALKEKPL